MPERSANVPKCGCQRAKSKIPLSAKALNVGAHCFCSCITTNCVCTHIDDNTE